MALECWLAEFRALRDAIMVRLRFQLIITAINVSAIGTITGLAFSDFRLFIAMPIVAPLLGAWFINQTTDLDMAGHYIHDKIAPALQRLSGDQTVLRWEHEIRAIERSRSLLGRVLLWRPAVYLFLLPSVVGLIISCKELLRGTEWWLWALWVVGLVLLVFLVWYWQWERKYWLGESECPKSPKSS